MRHVPITALVAALVWAATFQPIRAAEPPSADPAAGKAQSQGDAKPSDNPPEPEMTAEEKAERQSRKACKIEICAAFRVRKASGADISCPVVKSWRKEALAKLVGKLKVTWPYGKIRCTSTVNLKRADLVKAMTDEKFKTQLDKHRVSCAIDRDKEGAAEIKFDFSPTVTFANGKATAAKINWGKIEAPTLIKSALWTATAADNTVNILSGTLTEDINDFIDKRCEEVRSEWQGK